MIGIAQCIAWLFFRIAYAKNIATKRKYQSVPSEPSDRDLSGLVPSSSTNRFPYASSSLFASQGETNDVLQKSLFKLFDCVIAYVVKVLMHFSGHV